MLRTVLCSSYIKSLISTDLELPPCFSLLYIVCSKSACNTLACHTDRDQLHVFTKVWPPVTQNSLSAPPFSVKSSAEEIRTGTDLNSPSMNESLTLAVKLMNIVIHSTIHLSYLEVIDYFTEIMCLGLQMKITQDHSLSGRQIKFQTLLL